ncbi:unnamed protein product [Boreogadus saida]
MRPQPLWLNLFYSKRGKPYDVRDVIEPYYPGPPAPHGAHQGAAATVSAAPSLLWGPGQEAVGGRTEERHGPVPGEADFVPDLVGQTEGQRNKHHRSPSPQDGGEGRALEKAPLHI